MEAAALQIELGEFFWHELSTSDGQASAAFYRQVVGWRIRSRPSEQEVGYYGTLLAEGVPVAGMAHYVSTR